MGFLLLKQSFPLLLAVAGGFDDPVAAVGERNSNNDEGSSLSEGAETLYVRSGSEDRQGGFCEDLWTGSARKREEIALDRDASFDWGTGGASRSPLDVSVSLSVSA